MDDRLNSTWWTLKIAFGVVPFLAGLDKFFNVLANWTDYLNPAILELVPVDAPTFMMGVGIVEMLAGALVLTPWTRLGAAIVGLWLIAIAVSLILMGKYLDVAVRDLVMSVGAFALLRLSSVRKTADVESTATEERIGSTTFSLRPS